MNTQNPHEKTPSEKLRELIETYHGISAIPNEALKVIGYVKTETGRIVRADAREEIEQKDKQNEQQKKIKIENIPFRRIGVKFATKKIHGRRLESKDIDNLKEKIWVFTNHGEDDIKGVLPDALLYISPNPEFIKNFINNFLVKFEDEEDLPEIISRTSNHVIDDIFKTFETNIEIPEYIYDSLGEKDYVPYSTTEIFYEDLERIKGKICDTAEYRKKFYKDIKKQLDEYFFEDRPDLIYYCNKREITTYEELFIQYFLEFLKWSGFDDLTDKLKNCREITDLIAFLKSIKGPDLPSFEKEKKLKEEIKKAKTKEEKITLSQKLKEAGKNLKNEMIIIQGILECITPFETIPEHNKRKIEEIQKFLISSGKHEEKEELFYLDGEPNDALDKNPGAKSGDCTEGRPLPFKEPLVPFYNIKVFSEHNKYIGNIYLLNTHEAREKGEKSTKKIWHLEAIQIPSTINWDESIKMLIEAMAIEAEKKGIDIISVNTNPETISNYDYISNAVLGYYQQNPLKKRVDIAYPQFDDINDKYSKPQGNGQGLVLWENPKHKNK